MSPANESTTSVGRVSESITYDIQTDDKAGDALLISILFFSIVTSVAVLISIILVIVFLLYKNRALLKKVR